MSCQIDVCAAYLKSTMKNFEVLKLKIITKKKKCSSVLGIGDFAKEWKDKLLRFYILGNKCVSKTDKKMESLLLNR